MDEDERHRIDFKQHTLPPVSKWYLIRIIFYVVFLTLVGFAIYYLHGTKKTPPPKKDLDNIKEIRGVKLSESESDVFPNAVCRTNTVLPVT